MTRRHFIELLGIATVASVADAKADAPTTALPGQLRQQLEQASRIVDMHGGTLSLPQLEDFLYPLRREREDSCDRTTRVDVIDGMMPSSLSDEFYREMKIYYSEIFGACRGVSPSPYFRRPEMEDFYPCIVFMLPRIALSFAAFNVTTANRAIWMIDWSDISVSPLQTPPLVFCDHPMNHLLIENVGHFVRK